MLPSSFFAERILQSCCQFTCCLFCTVLHGTMTEAPRQKEKLFGNEQLKVMAKQSVKRKGQRTPITHWQWWHNSCLNTHTQYWLYWLEACALHLNSHKIRTIAPLSKIHSSYKIWYNLKMVIFGHQNYLVSVKDTIKIGLCSGAGMFVFILKFNQRETICK